MQITKIGRFRMALYVKIVRHSKVKISLAPAPPWTTTNVGPCMSPAGNWSWGVG